MTTPVLSVILPVFNAAQYLQEALNSISGQTFKNWEMLAIDDGSTDGSLDILNRHAATEARMQVISRENRGLVRTLNEGIGIARGEWIARMDADDVSLPDRFANQLAWTQKFQADLCGGGIQRIGVSGSHSWEFPDSNEGIYAWLLFRSAFSHPTVIIKTQIARKFPYDESFSHAQDYELWTRMALNNVVMTNFPEPVLLYRIHAEQISHAKKEQQTNLRMKITSAYWRHSPLSRNLEFQPCLVDERENIDVTKFKTVMQSLKTIESRLTDPQALAAVNHHRVWFIYRSIDLGPREIFPALKQLKLAKSKRIAVAILSIARARFLINYLRHADWIRHLPLKWLF